MLTPKKNTNTEDQSDGHAREWEDRARVIDLKEDLEERPSPRQSYIPGEEIEDVEEKSPKLDNSNNVQKDGNSNY